LERSGPHESSTNEPGRTPTPAGEEFLALFAETNHRIYSFVVTLLPASGDADEVFQRPSVILWRKFSEFRPGTDFVSWACRVAHLEALNYLRARQRDRLLFDEPLGAVRLPAR
jgi:RNA polymerase sigma-70 factor (ECF subfamily)